jgi:hypothetical protein
VLPDHRFGTMKYRTDGLTSKGETMGSPYLRHIACGIAVPIVS